MSIRYTPCASSPSPDSLSPGGMSTCSAVEWKLDPFSILPYKIHLTSHLPILPDCPSVVLLELVQSHHGRVEVEVDLESVCVCVCVCVYVMMMMMMIMI